MKTQELRLTRHLGWALALKFALLAALWVGFVRPHEGAAPSAAQVAARIVPTVSPPGASR